MWRQLVTFDGGDLLLYAVSARRDVQWPAFRNAADALLTLDSSITPDMRRARSLAASMGDALGHWDVLAGDGATARICIAPPSLACLPWPGLPRAVLCGSRSPDTLTAVAAAAASTEVTVRLRHIHPYAPARIEVTARTDAELASFADRLGVHHDPEPTAWLLASLSCSASEYVETLDWLPESELNWPCREFDPDRLAFGAFGQLPRGPRDPVQPRLLSYEHPAGWARRDRLTWAGKTAEVDRSWGRYLVLAAAGRRVLRVDKRHGIVGVPRQLPLPKLLARALTLSSGEPPRADQGPGLGEHVYWGVPAAISDAVANKLTLDVEGVNRMLVEVVR